MMRCEADDAAIPIVIHRRVFEFIEHSTSNITLGDKYQFSIARVKDQHSGNWFWTISCKDFAVPFEPLKVSVPNLVAVLAAIRPTSKNQFNPRYLRELADQLECEIGDAHKAFIAITPESNPTVAWSEDGDTLALLMPINDGDDAPEFTKVRDSFLAAFKVE